MKTTACDGVFVTEMGIPRGFGNVCTFYSNIYSIIPSVYNYRCGKMHTSFFRVAWSTLETPLASL